jgi:hypothetical protein
LKSTISTILKSEINNNTLYFKNFSITLKITNTPISN